MTIFLIEYDRPNGRLVRMESFGASEKAKAEKERLEVELELNRRGVSHEVVLLEAENKEALLRTHRRYFENASQIGQSINDDII